MFRRLRPYAFAAKDQCLFHALALLKFLAYYNIFPTWVIAVRPTPWAAHSWLQLGNHVLDCNPEEIRWIHAHIGHLSRCGGGHVSLRRADLGCR